MILYLTDNNIIHKKIPGSILMFQLLNWRVKYNSEVEYDSIAYSMMKTYKIKSLKQSFKNSFSHILIVARSNYKMIFDFYSIAKKGDRIYFWDTFYNRKQSKILKRQISTLMTGYLIRGYFSILMYDQISTLNMQRIEQLIIVLAIKYNKNNVSDIIEIPDYDVINYTKNKESISIFELINALFIEGYSFDKIIDKLMYHSRRLHITDPFSGYCHFLDTNNSLYKIFKKNHNLYIDNKTTLIINIYKTIQTIIPNVDFLKTLRFLINNEIISTNFQLSDYINDFLTQEYLGFLDKSLWSHIYKNKGFNLSDTLPYIDIEKNEIFCPVCGSTELKRTPKHYFCSDVQCSFSINGTINATGKIKKISKYDLSRLLKYGSTIIKNHNGGYNKYKLIEGKEGKFHILPEYKNNDVGVSNE